LSWRNAGPTNTGARQHARQLSKPAVREPPVSKLLPADISLAAAHDVLERQVTHVHWLHPRDAAHLHAAAAVVLRLQWRRHPPALRCALDCMLPAKSHAHRHSSAAAQQRTPSRLTQKPSTAARAPGSLACSACSAAALGLKL
jgi:hypothetical protein